MAFDSIPLMTPGRMIICLPRLECAFSSMYNVVFPIFILEKDSKDIARFDSIYQMQRQLEEIDIENHEYEAWDSAGASLSLQVQEPVWLQITPSSDLAPAALR